MLPPRAAHAAILAAFLSLSGALASPAQDLFNQVSTLIQRDYGGLSKVDRAALVQKYQAQLDAACAAQAASCSFETAFPVLEQEVDELGDQHSYFELPQDFSDFARRANGDNRLQFGVRLGALAGQQRLVLEVVPGSAAERAGLQRGDSIQSIDGQPYTFELLGKSREAGKPVQMGVQRGSQALTVTIQAGVTTTRELPRLTFKDDVAVIRIPTFLAGGGIGQRVHDLVRLAQRKGVKGVVVDLRDNGGGDLDECDTSASAFVPSFTRVSRERAGDSSTTVSRGTRREDGRTEASIDRPVLWDGPLTVLVNQQSGSCSEFFAFETQYAGRSLIVGEPTAGVGNSATLVTRLLGGAGLQLTVTHYEKPDGTPYPERVQPDVASKDDYERLAKGEDVGLNAAVAALSGAPAIGESGPQRAKPGN